MMICVLTIGAGGCVSSTLDSNQFRPVGAQNKVVQNTTAGAFGDQPVSLNSNDSVAVASSSSSIDSAIASVKTDSADPNGVDEAAKQQAIAEMRAKGQQTSGQKTQIGALPETAASQLTLEERATKSAELAKKVDEVNGEVSDAEVDAKQASIRRLQQKARSHYQNAITKIEN